MSSQESSANHALRVGLGAVAWGLILLVAWAIYPVEAVASISPVENPTEAEQASIAEVMGDPDEPPPTLIERFDCDSTPLQAVTGGDGASDAPALAPGFEYEEAPCSSEYSAAVAAFWVNALVIAAVIAACVAIHSRRRDQSSDSTDDADDEMAAALSQE